MAFGLKKLFAKKEGGSVAGNLLRFGLKTASNVFTGGTMNSLVDAVNPVPTAPPAVQKVASQALQFVAELPAVNSATAQNFASQAVSQVIKAGGTEEEAKTVGAQVQSLAQEPPKAPAPKATVSVSLKDLDGTLAAQKALGTTLADTPAAVETLAKNQGITKDQVLDILKDGGIAAKDAMVQAWLDKTKSGQDTKSEAIIGQLQKYALPILCVVGGVWLFKNKK